MSYELFAPFLADDRVREFGASFASPDSSAPTADRVQEPDSFNLMSMFGMGHLVGDLGRGLAQEGLAGIGDLVGMLDRQSAQRELAEKFEILSDEELAKRTGAAGNVVSQKEFQDIARTYSDIRLDRTDIDIDSSTISDPEKAAAFEKDTMGDIGNLLQTPSGRRLIGQLAHQYDDHKTTIQLNTDAAGNADTSNAEAGGDPRRSGSDHDYVGKDALVKYVPGDDGGIQQPAHPQAWMPMRSDITLFHELVHGLHATEGNIAQGNLQAKEGAKKIDVDEMRMEYQAVGLGLFHEEELTENAYRAERAAIGAGIGARTTGGVADQDVVQRDQYLWAPRTP